MPWAPQTKSGDTNEKLAVAGSCTTGGSLTLDVDFIGGGANRLIISGSVSGAEATTVNLRAGAGISDSSSATVPAAVLIDVAGSHVGADDDFAPGRIYDGVTMHDFTPKRPSSDGDRRIAAIGAAATQTPGSTVPGPVASFSLPISSGNSRPVTAPAITSRGTENAFSDWKGQLGGLALDDSDSSGAPIRQRYDHAIRSRL